MSENAWRTLIVESRSDLRLDGETLKVIQGGQTHIFPLKQLRTIILESRSVTLSTALINEIAEHNISMIVCDKRHFPKAQLVPFNGNVLSNENFRKQILWDESLKGMVWDTIITNKIKNQLSLISKEKRIDKSDKEQMRFYADAPHFDDIAEAKAAQIYFRNAFGENFRRNTNDDVNALLDYGYTILLSLISRRISLHGYSNTFGFHHRSKRNPWNLACDCIEPFRPFVDEEILNMEEKKLTGDMKKKLIAIGDKEITYDRKIMTVDTAADRMISDILRTMETGVHEVKELSFV